MLNNFLYALRYIKYRLNAKDEHSLHSPFLFDLYENVFNPNIQYYKYQEIEPLRNKWVNSSEKINVTDFGAGSRVDNGTQRKVSSIAKSAVKPSKYGQLLFRLVNYYKPKTIIELGTSLGITTCYLASANSNNSVITFEGCPNIAKIAKQNFDKLNLKNVKLIEGNFDHTFQVNLDKLTQIDFAFVDGNHKKNPTLNYFNLLLEKSHNQTILVFDDIHWSIEMEEAWNEIKDHPKVTVTIDLFYLGVVFLRKEQAKQHFVLKF